MLEVFVDVFTKFGDGFGGELLSGEFVFGVYLDQDRAS